MEGVERWWAWVQIARGVLLPRRPAGGVLPFHPYLIGERWKIVWGLPRVLLHRRRCPPGEEVG